jgi:hypothetical protein
MVLCPTCGFSNKEGSKFCNQCGTTLSTIPTSGGKLRCPSCGTLNAPNNVFCDKCNTRLVPPAPARREEPPAAPAQPAPVKGLQLPTREPSASGDDDLPDWLRQLQGAAAGGEPAQPAAGGAQPAAMSQPDLPDWLRAASGSSGDQAGAGAPASQPSAPEPDLPDWLRVASGAAAPTSQPAAMPEADLPDWLRGTTAPSADVAAAAPAPQPAAAPEPEMPDWLRDLGGPSAPPAAPEPLRPAPAPSTPPPAAPPEAAADLDAIPDWLRGLQPAETAPEPPPLAETPAQAPQLAPADVPDWLAGLRATAQPSEPEEESGLAPADVPDWLRDLGGPSAPPAAPVAATPEPRRPAPVPSTPPPVETPARPPAAAADDLLTPVDAEIPDWLRGADSGATGSAMPDWLAAAGAPAPAPSAPARPPAAPPPQAGAEPELPAAEPAEEIPGWLRSAGMSAGSGSGELAPADIPDWLKALRPGGSGPAEMGEALPSGSEWEAVPLGGGAAEEAGGLAQATIPDWLEALRPRELSGGGAAAPAIAEPAETSGVLAGIRGVIAAEPIIAVPRQAGMASQVMVDSEHQQLADLLRDLAAEEGPVQGRMLAPRAIVRAAERGLIYLIVLLAALLPALAVFIPDVKAPLAGLFPQAAPAGAFSVQSATGAYTSLDGLQPGDTVLVGFDTNAAGYGELRPLALALAEHLAARQAHVVLVSTQPGGAGLAEELFATDLPRAGGAFSATAYSNLGFLPGGPVGLALLAEGRAGVIGSDFHGNANWATEPAVQGILIQEGNLAALDLSQVQRVVVITNDPQVLRAWVEQMHAHVPAVRVVAGVSAGIEAFALSYWNADGTAPLAGVVSGVAGADVYEQSLNHPLDARVPIPTPAGDSRAARGLVQLALALLIVAGVVVNGILLVVRRGR